MASAIKVKTDGIMTITHGGNDIDLPFEIICFAADEIRRIFRTSSVSNEPDFEAAEEFARKQRDKEG